MPDVTIRDLPRDVLERLEARAAAMGQSLESELRDIVSRAVPGPEERLASLEAFCAKYGLLQLHRSPEEVLECVKALATEPLRAVDNHVMDIVATTVAPPPFSPDEAVRQILTFRARHGPIKTHRPIDELIAEDREAR